MARMVISVVMICTRLLAVIFDGNNRKNNSSKNVDIRSNRNSNTNTESKSASLSPLVWHLSSFQ